MFNKKGTWTPGDILMFMVFYIPMTFIVFLFLVRIPENIMNSRIQVGELDNAILGDRIFNKISHQDPYTGRRYPGVLQSRKHFNISLINDSFLFKEKKRIAFKLYLGNKSIGYNKDYYEIARPLAPVRYGLLVANKEFYLLDEKITDKLVIEQVFDKKGR